MTTPAEIVAFWRGHEEQWFAKDEGFDAEVRARFEAAHHGAARRELNDWGASAEGALALCLLLDQVPRNIYRGSAHAFATDGLALPAADQALRDGHDRATPMPVRIFFYLPFEHAENVGAQARATALFEATGNGEYVKYARLHRDVIARFGRFPHRNQALGRVTTPEEQAFLDGGGFSG